MSIYARGSKAFGFCDRCDFRYPLRDLRREFQNSVDTGIRVCPTCWDSDHPQLHLGEIDATDSEALRNPRPDTGQGVSRGLFGFDPVWNDAQRMRIYLSNVTVTIT